MVSISSGQRMTLGSVSPTVAPLSVVHILLVFPIKRRFPKEAMCEYLLHHLGL